MQAKKKNPPHKSKRDEEDKYKYIPVISMDYMYMNEKGDDDNNPILVMHDSMSEGVLAIMVKRKEGNGYAVKRVR